MEYTILGILLIILMLLYFKVADRYNIIDKPNQRSSHTEVTLRGGGVIFWFSALLYFVQHVQDNYYFFIGITLVSLVSFWDDIQSLSNKIRMSIQCLAISLIFFEIGVFSLVPVFGIITAYVLAIGLINAYNFMDGINGITGGYSLVVMGSFWYINNFLYLFIDNNLIYIISLSLFVFNFFNFRKRARCFAGDVGSVSMAFIILFLLGKLIVQTGDITYIIILLVYGVDSILTIAHRLMLKENIFEAHRKHMYQIMSNELHIPQIYVSLIYMAVQAAVMSGYFAFKAFGTGYFIILAFVTGIIYIVFMRKYYILHLK